MELYFAEIAAAARLKELGVTLPPNVVSALAGLETPEGMPFFLGEDGSYASDLNAFFRALPELRCPSPDTWRGYAMDLLGLHRFLTERRRLRGVLEAGPKDFAAFKQARLQGVETRVDPKTWNRSLAAFDKFYRWAKKQRLVADLPFDYVDRNVMTHRGRQTVASNVLAEQVDDDEGEVKCISVEDYRFFRDVGLRGFLPGRTDRDDAFRGRNAQRNAALADFLVGTGMRVTEALSLFRDELPVTVEGVGSQPVQLARMTTKNRRRRSILIPNKYLHACLDHYYPKDRREAVDRAIESGRYERAIFVRARAAGQRYYRFGDGAKDAILSFDLMLPKQRRRMLLADAEGRATEPAVFWLDERGLPLTDGNVRMIFAQACRRCAKWRKIDCSSHTLRHTYAVHMLTVFLRRSIGSIDRLRAAGADSAEHKLRQITMNPLDRLRRLLGHRSMTTTLKYLTYVVESQEYVEAAVDRWGEESAGGQAIAELAWQVSGG